MVDAESVEIVRAPISVTQFHLLCDSVGWERIEPQYFEVALKNSVVCVHAIYQGTVVGFGRLVGDVGMYLYVQDLIVDPALQGRGVGGRLLAALEEGLETLGSARPAVRLVAADDVVEFYAAHGYREPRPGSRYLVKEVRALEPRDNRGTE